MKGVQLIQQWVDDQDWIKDSWSCSIRGQHPCGIQRGAPPDVHHMHHPFVAIPLGYRSTETGKGVSLRIYVIEPKTASGAIIVFRINSDVDNKNYVYAKDCYQFSDPELFPKLEKAVREALNVGL